MLEFDENHIPTSDDEIKTYYLQCNYFEDSKEAIEHAKIIVKKTIIPELLIRFKEENLNLIDLWLLELLEVHALSFKHSAFESERETRLVVSRKSNDQSINFRVKGDLLIPYIKLKTNPLALTTITVGPIENQRLSVSSLKIFANQISQEIRRSQNEENYCLYIDSSDIPYRNI